MSAIREKYTLAAFFDHYKEITAKGIALRAGINPSLLSQYISGRRKPSAKQLAKISAAINQLGQELKTTEF